MGVEVSKSGIDEDAAPSTDSSEATRALQVSFDVFVIACCRRSPDAFVSAGVLESAFRAYLRESGLQMRDGGIDALCAESRPIIPTALGGDRTRIRLETGGVTGGGVYAGISLERWPTPGVTMGRGRGRAP
jgi:hypothetical protein